MSEPDLSSIDPRRDHMCFACGTQNPLGLHLEFRRDEGGVVARYRPRHEDQGFPGRVHGGLLGVMLDEAMGWALFIEETFAVTARMETRFRGPASLDGELEVRARVTHHSSRGWRVTSEIRTEAGTVIAEAKGVFVRMPEAQEVAARGSLEGVGSRG